MAPSKTEDVEAKYDVALSCEFSSFRNLPVTMPITILLVSATVAITGRY